MPDVYWLTLFGTNAIASPKQKCVKDCFVFGGDIRVLGPCAMLVFCKSYQERLVA